MRCFVPFCKNASENVSERDGQRISFHGFPSEVHRRAAWLRALGQQDSHLPDSAVVCSQHFLCDDIHETGGGLRQIEISAMPSTVQVCMICLDTDSKLFLMGKHKLQEAYEKLTGHRLCDLANLKQTLCVQCAHSLIKFNRFRDKSLRARALMMDLVEKHELITRQHVEMINRSKHQLKSNMVLTTLGPDHCDLHILEHPPEDKQAEKEESEHMFVVKTEETDDSMSVDEDTEVMYEDDENVDDFVPDPLKYESAPFQCTLCLEEFLLEHAYMQHVSMHLQNGDDDGEYDTSRVCEPRTAVSCSASRSSLLTENKAADPSTCTHAALAAATALSTSVATNGNKGHATEEADIFQKTNDDVTALSTSVATNDENKVHATEEADIFQKINDDGEFENQSSSKMSVNINTFKNCVVKLYDIFTNMKVVTKHDGPVTRTRITDMVCDSRDIASKDSSYRATSQNEVLPTEYIVPVTSSSTSLSNVINTLQCINSSQNSLHTEEGSFTCDICRKTCNRKSLLVKHIKTHSEVRGFTCKTCQYKCKYQYLLTRHMVTHTGIKPFSCDLCDSKCARNRDLVRHMRTHTGIKPFSCKLCDYKCAHNSHLVTHMRTHTGIKPFSCDLCDYKCARNSDLVPHMRTHSGIKPFSCKLCNHKFARNWNLVTHMRTHTGIKSFSCKLCNYKCARNDNLVMHMRTHSGIKPFSCKLCDYKSSLNSSLVKHMSTHTDII
ncbi:zinc finger protein 271-like isoform X2 [Maniola jurtina]|uniref:zinc finger protein 271-like isoform X2 n=1 Tax=Maniola jurtina TaxID=191418 RepID=UPI001E68B272|nr:zinc finger protein 271-like isoform X2 [Maniola jurtina]